MKVDAKGGIRLGSAAKELFGQDEKLCVLYYGDQFAVYTEERLEQIVHDMIEALDAKTRSEIEDIQRYVYSRADYFDLDSAGRYIIPQHHRAQYAGAEMDIRPVVKEKGKYLSVMTREQRQKYEQGEVDKTATNKVVRNK